LEKVYEILRNHPINFERKKKKLLPANYLFVRGAGIEIPKLKQYRKWISTNYMPLEIGFSKVSGIKNYSFDYPKMRNSDVYGNLYEGLKMACEHSMKILSKHYKESDYAYVHIKETDLPGHDDKPHDKKKMIEFLDKTLFKFLKEFAIKNEINVVVTADHCTPCNLKNHSADPVPVLFYNNSEEKPRKFSEKECSNGELGTILGKDLLKRVGFLK
jgi:2,3-bisphosphoglycerate-independent phosphoglycerate mutase